MAENERVTTTDHDAIRRWVESNDGFPARVPAAEASGPGGVLRLDFTGGAPTEDIEHLTWDDWFAIFDDERLAFVHTAADSDLAGSDRDAYFAFVHR
ncbi:hypothetical protein [Rhodococcus sp. HNM0569]|uniref:hypothetical protein n=1 Tax=Rhodococcus sp. HNM0569 TaxID=2716340 RepID=UPI00146B3AE2|nr:hypothetical protein [Rhodococcus sp. HNM0569]NLU83523.1 hypothetical protein [Rhodococcus sp. HNM0569]